MRYASKRSYTWSPNIAYAVGLITSDGCLQKDGRHIDLTSNDVDQLKNFNVALGRDIAIGQKRSGDGNIAYRIQFSDVAFYDFLILCGLTVKKSLTLSALSIPDAFYTDFLRGLFDGDGTCYAYIDKRWKSSHMFYVSFAAASLPFLEYIREQNIRIINTTAGSIRRGNRVQSLCYAKADSKLLFEAMYSKENSIKLKRKYDKLESFTKFTFNDTIIQD